jgi:hypothetical protein
MINSASRNIYYTRDIKPAVQLCQDKIEPLDKIFNLSSTPAEFWKRVTQAFETDEVQKIANKVGLKYQSVRKWKLGKSIGLDNLVRIRNLTGSSIDWLLTGEGPQKFADLKAHEKREASENVEITTENNPIVIGVKHLVGELDEIKKEQARILSSVLSTGQNNMSTDRTLGRKILEVEETRKIIKEELGLDVSTREYVLILDKKYDNISPEKIEAVEAALQDRLSELIAQKLKKKA